jgi:outer membrane receptor protein involved in Fe transport
MPVVYSKGRSVLLTHTPVASAVLLALGSPSALAQQTPQEQGGSATALGEVIVTAQKREQSLQDVPISVDALGQEKMEELNVQNFKDYVQFLPSVSMQPSIGAGSGFNAVYMRGIATGGDGQATTSQPSVGMYLDEQPITTIQGNLDVHLYDIARVEALAGPQGTLYGASSQAGTIRIITNKPDPSGFTSGFSAEVNMVDGDDTGYVAEGFVNLPLSDNMALRVVGWGLNEAGWVDNKPATRVYPGDQSTTADDFVTNNDRFVEKNYNTSVTVGGRASLGINLGENWTVTPQVMYQRQDQQGSWGDDLNDVLVSGDYAVAHFRPEYTDDEWWSAGMTVEGNIANFDVVYAGNYLDRDVNGEFDYSDYSYWYDNAYTSGFFTGLFFNNAGEQINPDASFSNDDHYTKVSHEIRISTPQDKRVRGLLGFFYQKQYHDFYQEFGRLHGLADVMLMNSQEPGAQQFPGVVYLNSMDRTDRDEAIFGSIDFDLSDKWTLSLGARYFEPEVHVKGFFGFGLGFSDAHTPGYGDDNIPGTADDELDADGNPVEPGDPRLGGEGNYRPDAVDYWSHNGEWRCPSEADRKDAPCQNVDKTINESDSVYRVNLQWKATDTAMLYATWSEGYRPGGINRNPFAGGYIRDILTNYEIGWKTRLANDRVQLNGAVFLENWDDIQVSFQGGNGITQVANGGEAEVKGIEAQLDWLPTDSLRIGLALAYYDSELKKDFCDFDDAGNCINVKAPKGTPLPITPEFKGNLIARYSFPVGGFNAYTQGTVAYQGSASSQLELADNAVYGDIPASTFVNLAFGTEWDKNTVELFISNVTNEDAPLGVTSECTPQVCGVQTKGVKARPQTIGIRYSHDF